jgi:hypothetical protein
MAGMSNTERMKQMFFEGRLNGLIAALILALAVVMHGLLPRYEVASIYDGAFVRRFDTWTGEVCVQRVLGNYTYGEDARGLWMCYTRTMQKPRN